MYFFRKSMFYHILKKIRTQYEQKIAYKIFFLLGHQLNKAGFMATSCRLVGRGGNARFPTFRLDYPYGPTNRLTDQPTDGQSFL